MNVSDPEKLGFCHQRLNRIEPRLSYIDNSDIAGISTLVARRGQVVNRSLIGLMSRPKHQFHQTLSSGSILWQNPLSVLPWWRCTKKADFTLINPITIFASICQSRSIGNRREYREIDTKSAGDFDQRSVYPHIWAFVHISGRFSGGKIPCFTVTNWCVYQSIGCSTVNRWSSTIIPSGRKVAL